MVDWIYCNNYMLVDGEEASPKMSFRSVIVLSLLHLLSAQGEITSIYV